LRLYLQSLLVWGSYCGTQAACNLKPPFEVAKIEHSLIVPRDEFTELGLWYGRRYFTLN
jgi:hypothetical protein